ncbi:MAG TPA: zinc-finger domain-containing protein, partial [Gammaproteobacteria bacterium]|nr:zinc-finger domain-containing protein [Gammaproteobacteria bacterium]
MAAPQIPNAQKVYHVTWKDLPLSCPTRAMSLWNSHQRVYLDIQEGG